MKNISRLLICASLFFLIILTAPLSVAAGELPIDINAIRPQAGAAQPFAPHFGANLFTPDSLRANEAVYAQFTRRQETSVYLFGTVPAMRDVDIHEHIMNAAYSQALFSSPANFAHVSFPAPEAAISNGFIAFVVVMSAIAGFILASALKKKRRAADVH